MVGHREDDHVARDDEVDEEVKVLVETDQGKEALEPTARHEPLDLELLLHHETLNVDPLALLDFLLGVALHLLVHAVESLYDHAHE